MQENAVATNFELRECVMFAQSTKIGIHENKAIHSNCTKFPQSLNRLSCKFKPKSEI